MILMLELLAFPGPPSPRSPLRANSDRGCQPITEADPIAARIHELRLTIVEDVLGFGEGDGSEAPAIALLMQDPVPTATPKASSISSPTSQPSASPVPTDTPTDIPAETALPAPSNTPPPVISGYCENLSISGMEVSGDDVKAKVHNSGSKDVYLIKTVFEWPDVPEPAYVDYFGARWHTGRR